MKKIITTFKITDLKPSDLIMFTTSRGRKGFAKIKSIDPKFEDILIFDAIGIDDFTPIRGRFGGLNIKASQVTQIIKA